MTNTPTQVGIKQGYHRVSPSTFLNVYEKTGDKMTLATQLASSELIYILGQSQEENYLDAVRIRDGYNVFMDPQDIHKCIDITDYNEDQRSIDTRGTRENLNRKELIQKALRLAELFETYTAMGPEYAETRKAQLAKHRKHGTPPQGVPGQYVWGANTDKNYDCSGLVQKLYYDNGILLPRNASQQYAQCDIISRADLLPGDLVFFRKKAGEQVASITHVGLAIDKDFYVHASGTNGNGGIAINSLDKIKEDISLTQPTGFEGFSHVHTISAATNEYYLRNYDIEYGRVKPGFQPDYWGIPEAHKPTPRAS